MGGSLTLVPASTATVWSDTALLLSLRARQARNTIRFAPGIQKTVGLLLLLASLLLAIGLYVASAYLFNGISRVQPALTTPLAGRTIHYSFLFLLASGLPFVSGALLTPGDLPLLGSSPVRAHAVVLARLVDAVVVSSAQFVVLGGPLLLASAQALGATRGIGVWLLLPVSLLFLSLPALLLAFLVFGLARIVGVRRLRVAVTLASVIVSVGLCLAGVGEASRHAGQNLTQLAQTLPGDLPPLPAYLPSTWAAQALANSGDGTPAAAFSSLGALLALAVSLALACTFLGAPLLVGESLLEDEGGNVRAGIGSTLEAWGQPGTFRALLVKDARYLARDLTLLSQIGVPLILYAVPWIIAAQVRGQADERFALSVGVVGIVAYMETSILGLSSIGLEGAGGWHLWAAPASMGHILLAKWTGAWAGSLLLTVPMLWLFCLTAHASSSTTLTASGLCVIACATLAALAVGVSGLFPRFIYDNPAHRASLTALIWGFVGATAYIVVSGVLWGGAWWLSSQGTGGDHLTLIAGAVWLVISLATGLLPLLAARARLEGHVWEES